MFVHNADASGRLCDQLTMESTELCLPPELPYPITISSLDLHHPAEITRGARLLTYSFVHVSISSGTSETRFGTWDSPIEGTLETWKIKPGAVITQKRVLEPVVLIKEPCKHGMQVGGLCGLCGKDMTDFDYTGFSNASRANIQMTHSATGPTVSFEEAQRFERETAAHLLKSRKLSLIVDLDQTIVHATVDPTVGEWIAEGEAWDTKRGNDDEKKESSSDSPSDSPLDSLSDVNPNWEALKDVKKFRLATEGVAPRTPFRSRLDAQGCMYYIKPRPGLQDFLAQMSEKYEMHVYTMGTRAYAESVCTAIDPEGTIFRGRILSRDESGSLTQKSLQRLFPCDTSMVVIIDDRADVWGWSPNLLKVRPYDFFVGIGDINSTFLPKPRSLVPSTSDSPTPPPPIEVAPSDPLSTESEAEAEAEFADQNRMTIERIAAQVEERPLAKKQEELLENGAKAKSQDEDGKVVENGERSGEDESKSEKDPTPSKRALLKNDDTELVRVSSLLNEVHKRFYDAYDARLPETQTKKRKVQLDGRPVEPAVSYDVKAIITRIRAETLTGTHILFSSVIPLDVDPPMSEIWRTAEVFGAVCHTSVSSRVTHVVAAKRGTVKVDAARRHGGIHIVWLAWFLDSLALWRRQDEASYLIDVEPATTSGTSRQPFPGPEIELDVDEADDELITPDPNMWADANAEVDSALEDTDDEDGTNSAFEDEGDSGLRTDSSAARYMVPRSLRPSYLNIVWCDSGSALLSPLRKKRARSSSVSDSGRSVSRRGNRDDDQARSPLAKRKRISAARRGSSRLKVGVVPDDIAESGDGDGDESDHDDAEEAQEGDAEREVDSEGRTREEQESIDSTDGNGADGAGDEDDDDDFLARELEEEVG
ncbi:hypothetical protein K439DRAFT_1419191 [Ramaria rubella]|nr:hypothetical protein K439DRAFT_1419191 [Ramaria rubella]